MLKATALMVCLALPAMAAPVSITLNEAQPYKAEVVEVQTHPNPVGTIVGDAVGGALLGGAIGAGVAVYNRYGTTNGTWDNWQRPVLIGAGIGLGVGLIVGGISAASQSSSTADRVYSSTADGVRDIGLSPAYGAYSGKF